jgi:hypothetical protein
MKRKNSRFINYKNQVFKYQSRDFLWKEIPGIPITFYLNFCIFSLVLKNAEQAVKTIKQINTLIRNYENICFISDFE